MIASLTVNPAPDIAVNSTVSVSSENISTAQLGIKAIDGVIGGCPNDCANEWATVGELGCGLTHQHRMDPIGLELHHHIGS